MTGSDGLTALIARLTERARQLAQSRLTEARLTRCDDPRRWRDARLVWPLFTSLPAKD